MQKKLFPFCIVFSLFLLVFVAAFLLRSGDDNSLFSWSWILGRVDASRLYLLLIAGLVVSSFFAGRAVDARYQIPFLAVLSFAVVVPLWQEPEIIVDASRYFTQAKHLEVYGIGYFGREWGKTIAAWTDMPLVPFLYGLVFKVFGENRLAIQLFTTSMFSLTTVLTCLIGERLWDRETGFAAGLFLLGMPFLLTQVPLMLVDVPTMFFLMLAVFSFLEAMTRGGVARNFFSAVAVACSLLSKYSAWFMLSVLVIMLFVYGSHDSDRTRVRRGLFVLIGSAAFSGMVLLLMRDVVFQQIALLQEYQRPGLGRWVETFHSTFLFQIHPFITVLALVSVWLGIRNRDRNYAIALWLVLLVVLFGIRRIRYILPVFPMFSLMAAYGLRIIRHRDVQRFILYGTAASTLIIVFFAYLPFARSMSSANLKNAGAYLNRLNIRNVEIITHAAPTSIVNPAVSVPLLDYFTIKKISYDYSPEALPLREEFEKSSLRFTWEYQNPAYYRSKLDANSNVIALISDFRTDPASPFLSSKLKGYRLSKTFLLNENVFRHVVAVRIYEK